MRWQGRRQSRNVEDRRGGRRPVAGAAVGGTGVVGLIVLLLVLYAGGDPQAVMDQLQQGGPAPGGAADGGGAVAADDELGQFVSVVLADTEDVWRDLFAGLGKQYREPRLVLFREAVESACGYQRSAVGPFYCPGDNKVYIDLSFFEEMERRLDAPGDFAQAYVIAHEVGHHVQNLLGISDQIHDLRRRASEQEANRLSVRQELQADFFAGVWAHHADRNWDILEPGDVDEALRAATAIGDDRLQMQGRGYVVPESFTHGTSAQRVRWFRLGLASGNLDDGDTYSIPYSDL